MTGRFIAVVGPSGVGKDSVMEALCAARPDLYRARRVITRPEAAGGEAFDGISPALFAARAAGGDFALHWQAHGLSYGIPREVHAILRSGRDVLANLSRAVLVKAGRVFDDVHVLHINATPEVLITRLEGRARETEAEIAKRLARSAPEIPEGMHVTEIDNSGTLGAAVAQAMAALYPEKV
ncbi:phosphonate metabolism protein/1,5-bisphosphokinase (PRPP-forming) PhnN [Maritalea mobilis]|uniref:phosphonate metabolism protein/1,5-bisphosphokinase (PRPP-forming) PhnN n=1 Tax=Maritalea mobilis TaxID=483324 RepID=UPI001C97B6B5|nr:phosphonate metabolism protein/1,5-bisphosphokinase (PRPP-forming) PhnN [Maritalea mobilis]MBY6200933.1 phosphonate metabolism protein/1,5-bisphosphokinase (PRPP-forming) PhnN [Maritalea mobilis]